MNEDGVRTIFSKHSPLPALPRPLPSLPPAAAPSQGHQGGGSTAGLLVPDATSSSTELAYHDSHTRPPPSSFGLPGFPMEVETAWTPASPAGRKAGLWDAIYLPMKNSVRC